MMRRKDREITDYRKMMEIVGRCDCCRIGLTDQEGAYIVPVNFGYEEKDGALILYFHGAGEGKKIDLIRKQPQAGFEMDTKHELVTGETACAYSYLFQSVMGRGEIQLLEDYQEKVHGLEKIMARYSDRENWSFPEKMVEKMAVIRLSVTKWSCKEH